MKTRKILSALLVVMILVLGLQTASLADPPTASEGPYIPATMDIIKAPSLGSRNISLEGVSKESDVTALKSSKPKVASVSTFTYEGTVYVAISPKKAGKTTVTFNYKYQKKTYKAKVVVTVANYENPFQSFKIGKKNYATQFDYDWNVVVPKALSGKLTLKLKKGWKVLSLYSYDFHNGEDFNSVSENKKISLKKGHRLDLVLMDPKGLERQFYLEVQD